MGALVKSTRGTLLREDRGLSRTLSFEVRGLGRLLLEMPQFARRLRILAEMHL
jgi:hypothetical protein